MAVKFSICFFCEEIKIGYGIHVRLIQMEYIKDIQYIIQVYIICGEELWNERNHS